MDSGGSWGDLGDRAWGKCGMCRLEENKELAAMALASVGSDEDAKALVRLLSYAADEAAAQNAPLTQTLIEASIEAMRLERGSTQPGAGASVMLT